MRRKKNLPLLSGLEILDIGAEGRSIARYDGMVVFVPGLIPGDIADVQVIRKRKNYLEARVVAVVKESELRVKPFCKHFGVCGGCKWQHLRYEYQLQYKHQQVRDQLQRIGKVAIPTVRPVLPSPEVQKYRNKLEFTFSSRRWLTPDQMQEVLAGENPGLGFHIEGRFDKVLDIETCYLQPEPSNSIRNAVRRFALEQGISFFDLRNQQGFLRTLIIRTSSTGEVMVIVVFFYDDPDLRCKILDFISASFLQVTSLFYVINPKGNDSIADLRLICYKGNGYLTEKIGDIIFQAGPLSFLQVNVRQAEVMYNQVAVFAALRGDEIVYDLYTGIGTIANYIAKNARKVIGIEFIDEAVNFAQRNSVINAIDNTSFFSGDIQNIFTVDFYEKHGQPDIVITDPPRAGMHEKVVRLLLEAMPRRIVYVSCNPATQARDILLLSSKYHVTAVQPVDMFPHTFHIECIVLLELNNTDVISTK